MSMCARSVSAESKRFGAGVWMLRELGRVTCCIDSHFTATVELLSVKAVDQARRSSASEVVASPYLDIAHV